MIDATKEQQAELLSILQNLDRFEHEVLDRTIIVSEKGKRLQYWIEYGGIMPNEDRSGIMQKMWPRVTIFDAGTKHDETLRSSNEELSEIILKIIKNRQDEILRNKHSFADGILSIFKRKMGRL